MANEKRLIDADALMNTLSGLLCDLFGYQDYNFGVERAIDVVEYAPTVDAVEVVRCKDCKHWKNEINGCTEEKRFCDIGFYMVHKNGFCSFGERKTNEFER